LAPCISRTHTEVTEPQQRRAATLLAEARELDTAAGDDALDLLDHAPGRPARRADRAGTLGAAADLPGLDLAAQGNATRCQGPARPAGQRPAGGGTRSAARCPARSSPPPCRQTGSAEQPGVATGSWGAAKSATTLDRGIRRSKPSNLSSGTHGPAPSCQQASDLPALDLGDPDLSNSGGYLGERRWRWPAPKISPIPVSVLPARGRVAPTRDPTRVRTLPISGSTRTPNSQRRSRMDRNMTRGYPTSHPSHPIAPPSGGRRRQTAAVVVGQRRVPTPG